LESARKNEEATYPLLVGAFCFRDVHSSAHPSLALEAPLNVLRPTVAALRRAKPLLMLEQAYGMVSTDQSHIRNTGYITSSLD